jgi:type IV pilus assembly protein PilB
MEETPSFPAEPPAQDRFRMALLAYNQEGLDEALNICNLSGIRGMVDLTWGDLAHHQEIECDIAMAVLTRYDTAEQFISDVASIHLVRKVPLVFAAIAADAASIIDGKIDELATPNVIRLPIEPEQFIKEVMTHVVSLKIQRERSTGPRPFGTQGRQLGQILVEHELITPVQLKKALDYQKKANLRLGDSLVALGYINEEQKNRFLSSQLGVGLATAKQYAAADINTVALIPEHTAKRNHCLALERDGNVLTVAMLDVLNLQLLDQLRDLTDLTINPVLGTKDEIQTSIDRFYRDISSQKDASDLIADLGDEVEYLKKEDEDEISAEEAAAAGAEMGIVKLVNMLITNAIHDKASDIHIEIGEKDLVVRTRLDGELRRVMTPPRQSHQAIITRIKILSNMDIAERRLPQDGRMVVKMGHREVDIRVSVLPTVYGEKVVMRILDKEAFEKSTANLGFSEKNLAIFSSNITKPYGMIVVTGPTGSGKSTTLYAAIQQVKDVRKNIITVEDPVEFHMDTINQVHVNSKIGLTFGAALRSILRQDPDIILIGEIRDNETADIAIKMALTGHLVFSTLHTNDAASTIARFVDIGIPPLLLGAALNLILAQRLIRRICPKCKAEYKPEDELLEQLNLAGRPDLKFYKGEGCVNCNGSGYKGRLGIFEMLAITREIRKLILKNAPTNEIQELAKEQGMSTLRDAGIQKILSGDTTVEQVIAATSEI